MELLTQAGHKVTQATVSRDIRELRLIKVTSSSGNKQKYAVLKREDSSLEEKYIRIMKDGFISMTAAENILVLKTVPGMAMAFAAALDAMKFKEIIGCIAGDDTIMAALASKNDAEHLVQKLTTMLE